MFGYLLFLQKLRELSAGVLDPFMLKVSELGEVFTVFLLLAFIYWCVDKRTGRLIAYNMALSCWINQWIKKVFKVDRPWIQDGRIKPVDAAIPGAGGYSMPSGHTHRAFATYGVLGVGLWRLGRGQGRDAGFNGVDHGVGGGNPGRDVGDNEINRNDNTDGKVKRNMPVNGKAEINGVISRKPETTGDGRLYRTLACFSFAVIPLIMFSRNYLGVHTFADVLVGLAIGIVVLILSDRMISFIDRKALEDPGRSFSYELILCIILSVIIFLPMLRFGCLSNAGGAYGLIWGMLLERRFVSFDTGAGTLRKAVRFIPGAAVVFFCFTSGTSVMGHIVPEKYAGFFLQAFAGFFIMFLYPAIFSIWEAEGEKARQSLAAASDRGQKGQVGKAGQGHARKRIVYIVASVFCILIVAGCVKMMKNMYQASDNEKVKIIAHRGFSGAAPENTMSAFNRAIDIGADMIETDVQMTKDGVLVLFHDDDIGRITGNIGEIADYTYEELLNMDFGAWFDEAQTFKGEKIPTLAEALELIRRSDLSIYLELKDISEASSLSAEQREMFPEMVAKEVEEHGMKDRVVYASFQYDYLIKFKAFREKNKTLLNTMEADADILINEYSSDYYGMNRDMVTEEAVGKLHEAGKTVYVWTVNTPEDMERITGMGVDGIVTNEPETAMGLL